MKKIFQTLFTALLAATLASAMTYFLTQDANESLNLAQNPDLVPTFSPSSETLPDFAKAAVRATPSVVFIKTFSERQRSMSWMDYYFGGGGRSTGRAAIGTGSGVVISEDGYIITNNHVINRADEIEVILAKRTYPAKLIGVDPSSDLALIKIDATDLSAIAFSNSDKLQVGQWVLAVGNPFNLTSTVTAGIVSAKGRSIDIMAGQFPLESFIQTDAAINPGNSGGALVDSDGNLVGINTAILSETGSYSGYGFAIPANVVRKIAGDLKEFGEVQKAFLGAQILEVNEEIADSFDLENIEGIVIARLEEGGAAQKAGLRRGDIILFIEKTKIRTKSDFDEKMSFYRPGDQLEMTIQRDGKVIVKTLTLTNVDGTTELLKREIYDAQSLGASLETVPLIERNRLKIANGVRIKDIRNGFIRRLGIREGFVVTSINNYAIAKPEEFVEIMERIRGRVIIKGVTPEGEKGYYTFNF